MARPRPTAFPRYDRAFPRLPWRRDKSRRFKIYVLVDPRDYTVRYVGVTSNAKKRRADHLGPQAMSTFEFAAWKVELWRERKRPLFAVVDSADEAEAFAHEARWIGYYLRFGMLFNQNGAERHLKRLYDWAPDKPLDAAPFRSTELNRIESGRAAWRAWKRRQFRDATAQQARELVDSFLRSK